jgi:sterol desaturase/sphingolipid hydroxylase (fatty acid hydroxylase superfamily)
VSASELTSRTPQPCDRPAAALVIALGVAAAAALPFAAEVLPSTAGYSVLTGRGLRDGEGLLAPVPFLMVAGILALELALPARREQAIFSRGLANDAIWLGVSTLCKATFVGAYVALLRRIYESQLSALTIDAVLAWPLWLRAIAGIAAADLLAWLHHFAHHRVTLLWNFHTTHHAQRELNFLTDDRVHPVERLAARTLTFVPLFALQNTLGLAVAWALASRVHTHLLHANVRLRLGWLRYVLVTPQSHRIHHSREPRHANRNFGVNLCVWDRLFGTHYEAAPDEYPETGVADDSAPREQKHELRELPLVVFAQLVDPFRRIARGLR